jgi:outer membrane protein
MVLVLVFSVFQFTNLNAQTLTLDEAIQIALEKNYDIQIAKNEMAIASNNNRAGNAGMLPSLDANFKQQFYIQH